MANPDVDSKINNAAIDRKILDLTAFYQSILEKVHDGILVTDEDDIVIYVNSGMEKIAGVKAADMLGKCITRDFPSGTIRYFGKFYDKAKSDREPQEFEAEVVTPAGRFTIQSGWLTPRLDGGRYNGTVCTIQDITERKQAEERLRASERKYSRLVEESPDIIMSFDRLGRLISCNSRTKQITGYSEKELVGKHFADFGLLTETDAQEILREFQAVVEGRAFTPRPLTITSKWGHPVILEVNARPVNRGNEEPVVQVVLRDVTERVKADEKLKQLNRSLEIAQDMAQVGYWNYNFKTGRREWSRTMFLMLGLSPADGIPAYEFHKELFHPDDWAILEQAIADCTEGTPYDLIIRAIGPDRLVRYLRAVGYPRYDETGEISELYGVLQDITELKTAEKAIRRSEQMYKSLYELSPNGVILIDSDSRIISVNKRIYDWLGYGDEDLLGKRSLDLFFIAPQSRKIMKSNFSGRLKGEQIPDYEIEMISKSGQKIIGLLSATMVKSDEVLCMVILRDVTEQHRVQEELRKSEAKYRSVVDNMAVGVSLLDTNMKVQAINPQLEKWFPGLDVSESPCCYRVFVNPPRDNACPDCPVVKTLEDGQIHEAVTETSVGGEVKNYRILSAPIKGEDGTVEGIIEVTEDVTARLKIERELFKAEKLESIGILAGGIANDFNNLLVGIMGNISLAKLSLEHDSEIFQLLQNAEDASERARDLTQRLLTFSPGGGPIKKIANLDKLLRDTVTFALHGVDIVGEFDIALDLLRAEVDMGQFIQVINNLVINAIQAMPKGGTIFIGASNAAIGSHGQLPLDPGNYIKISITDQGHGIPPEIMDKIFDPFFTTKSDGNGLGLASCYSIVKKHGGHISAESSPGRGTTFTLYLPAAEATDVEPLVESAEPVKECGKVLIVDDDEWVRRLAGEILGKMGFEVYTATNGEEAVGIARDIIGRGGKLDTALIDLTIPGGIGGKDIIHMLKDVYPDLKAIVSSGYSNDPVMGNYKAYGFSGRIAKPYRASELSDLISRVVNSSR